MLRVACFAASLAVLFFYDGDSLRAEELSPPNVEFFEKKIRPILIQRCYECHSAEADEPAGNLLLDRKAGWVQGGDLGPAIIPGDPEESLLIGAIRYAE
ncbi:MAG: hypothetical protein KY475_21515, partial [Planctomycetes bacterium]|nr:hypothetical protein [Planctomycetota bacterium]